MNEIVLKEENGKVLASSREVAEKFGKRHDKLVSEIERMYPDLIDPGCAQNGGDPMFVKSSYVHQQNKQRYQMYLMNRDGFSLLVMGFTGKKALEWKLKYIEAFNRMEEKLKSGYQLTEEERLKLQLFSKDASEVAYAHNRLVELATAPLVSQIEEQEPLVYFANKVSDSTNLISMGRMAKMLKEDHIDIGRNRLFLWLRNNGILMQDNIPYQRYIDNGYFAVKESTYDTFDETKTSQTTYVTGKGQIYITKKLRQEFNQKAAS